MDRARRSRRQGTGTVRDMQFSVWPNSVAPPGGDARHRPLGRRQRLVRGLVRRPLHAEHGHDRGQARPTSRVLGVLPAIAASPSGSASVRSSADVGAPSGAAREPRRDDRPPVRRAHRARPRRRLADQRAPRVRHRARTGRDERVSGSTRRSRSSARCSRRSAPLRRRVLHDITDAPCDPKPVQSPLPIVVGTGSPRMLTHHRPPRRRVEHVGHRRGGRAPAGRRSSRRMRGGRPRPGDDAHLGPGAPGHRPTPNRRPLGSADR
jgi:hypothetical protein